jgi:nucleolar protein 56
VSPAVLTTWFGAFVWEEGRIVRAYPYPADKDALRDRARARRSGELVPEERQLLVEAGEASLESRDRRLFVAGVRPSRLREPEIDPRPYGFEPSGWREILLDLAAEELAAAWDPSVHVDEAVRALADLDEVLNRLGERLVDWASRDAPIVEGEESESEGLGRLARRLQEGPTAVGPPPDGDRDAEPLPGPEPELVEARRAVASTWLDAQEAHGALERAIERALPRRAPNVSALLGPLLAARLISRAGGLARLARMPASTVQVLGAERAFFEHLRGRAPPPRHGLLFLHPAVQSSPRTARGRLARALAGKVAIAARLDRAGAPLRPELRSAFENRIPAARRAGRASEEARGRDRRRGRTALRPPLNRAPDDR